MLSLFDRTDEWKEAVASWEGIQDKPPKRYRDKSTGFQVMKNNFLEKYFATSHWAGPGVWAIPLFSYCLYDAGANKGIGWPVAIGLFALGILGWSFVEYALHRWLFHLQPSDIWIVREYQYVLHGYHHDFPDDPGRLVAPPALAWPLATVLALIYWASFGPYWTALFGGTVAGYLAYDWVHYYTHHGKPITIAGKFMRRFHNEHHFKQADTQYGLSSPLWDLVFGSFWTTGAIKELKRAAKKKGTSK